MGGGERGGTHPSRGPPRGIGPALAAGPQSPREPRSGTSWRPPRRGLLPPRRPRRHGAAAPLTPAGARARSGSAGPPAGGEGKDLNLVPGREPPREALYNLGVLCAGPGGLYGPLGGAPAGVPGQWAAAAARWFALAVEKAARDTGNAVGRVV